jgi:kinesin family protein 3/17
MYIHNKNTSVAFNGLNFKQLSDDHTKPYSLPQTQLIKDKATRSTSPSQASILTSNNNFKVVIRVRPPLQRELINQTNFESVCQVSSDGTSITISEYLGGEIDEELRIKDIAANPQLAQCHTFTFDNVFDQQSTQQYVYEQTARPAVLNTLEGYNASIIAYGQTGTGKTHTMEGFQYNGMHPDRGMVPRAMEEIFKYIENCPNSNTAFMVRASYLQIYNEVISDLLKTERVNLQIREDKKKGVFVEGLSEWAVRSPNEIYSLISKGAQYRATASTKMNDVSSRSHAVFIIIVEQMSMVEYTEAESGEVNKQMRVGKLNLVDLAGSERLSVTGATGKRLEECKNINQSLSALGNVISALTEKKLRMHIPYRDSKLTRLLEDSLGGNCKTTMMAMISPAYSSIAESISSLKFANRAKHIKNEAKINEDLDQRALLRKYEVELKKLKKELDEKNKDITDKELLMKLEDEKKKAEEDKEAAINELEMRSKEYFQEKEEKKRLEEKIQMMNSQMLMGGKKIEDTPQFISALEEKQKQIREEYDRKLADFEKERQLIEEDKAQNDRYKQLLLKQRDIMIALTARLNERDETIIQLQEELDAYDRIHKETEDALERKMARVSTLEEILEKNNIPFPVEDNLGTATYSIPEKKYQPYNQPESDIPMSLLSADEKIAELSEILANKDKNNENIPSNEIDGLRKRIKELEETNYNLSNKLAFADPNVKPLREELDRFTQERNSLKGILETELQNLAQNIVNGIKGQRDQYRLYHIMQDANSMLSAIQASSQILASKKKPIATLEHRTPLRAEQNALNASRSPYKV